MADMDSGFKDSKKESPGAEGGTLKGWKEIAAYLGREIRSVQRWEKTRGLPVHRTSRDRRAGRPAVQALPSELDDWLRGSVSPPDAGAKEDAALPPVATNIIGEAGTPPGQRRLRGSRLPSRPAQGWALAGLLLLTGIIVVGATFLSRERGRPETVALEHRNTLVARGADGKMLWQRDFNPKTATSFVDEAIPPLLVDLDHNSRDEVVFSYMTEGDEAEDKDLVLCLDEKGSEVWTYQPGGAMVLGGVTVPDCYHIRRTSAAGRLAGGGHFVAVIANNRVLGASQASILDPAGRRIGEYWHAGWIFDYEILDCNHDGVDEIALVGVDEPAGKAFLALIAADTPKSISPVPDGYAPGMEMHKELGYILFPVSQPASVLGRGNRAVRVKKYTFPEGLMVGVLQQGGERDMIERSYLLDMRLQVLRLYLSDEFLFQGNRLQAAKLLPRNWQADELARLRRIQPIARK